MRDGRHVIARTPMRNAIARRMVESKQTVPHFYETVEVEMDAADELLERLDDGRSRPTRIGVTALLVRALALSLADHPAFNAVWEKDDLVQCDEINIGVAIEVPDGLLAPAILNCRALDLESIAAALHDLIARAKAGKVRSAEWSDATFTLSNLGMFEIAQFTAIVVPPQVAILAVGRSTPRAVVRDGAVVARRVMTATLSADHRAVDGASAARFLGTLKRYLELPAELSAVRGASGTGVNA